MKKFFILAAAAAMMLSACSFDRDLDYGDSGSREGRIPLGIGYSLESLNSYSATRGNFNDVQNTALLNGDKESDGTTEVKNTIGLFIMKKNAVVTSESYEVQNLTSSSITSNDPASNYYAINTTSALSYPEDKSQELDIYAYAPYVNTAWTLKSDDITSKKIAFTTATNQTTKANYMASDVLWGCAGTGTYVDAAVGTTGPYTALSKTGNKNEISAREYLLFKNNVTKTISGDGTHRDYTAMTSDGIAAAYYFKSGTPNRADVVVPLLHRGSKIVVKLKASGMDLAKLQNAEVKFYVDHKAGELNVSTGALTTTDGAAATAITLTDRLGIKETVANANDAITEEGKEGTDTYVCSAVIIPQKNWTANGDDAATTPSTKGANNIITIDLYSDNRAHGTSTVTATYGYKTGAEATTFEAGKVYTYTITVKASGLTVTTTVSDWTDATSSLPGTTPGAGEAELQ